MYREYWRKIHRVAIAETRKTFGLEAPEQIILRILMAIAVIAALIFVGSKGAAHDEIVVRIALCSLILFLFPAFYLWNLVRTPADLDTKNSQHTIRLQSQITELERFSTVVNRKWIPTGLIF